ncbi:MAG: hypothetical protein ACREJU_07285 [Nitrospiraceae bacterium]
MTMTVWGAAVMTGCGSVVTFTVNTPFDLHDTNVGDLQCVANAAAELCSLRAAVEQANAFTPGTTHIVINVPSDTYELNAQPENHLTLNSDRFVEILAANPATTIVQPATGVNTKVFHILGGLFRLSNLTIRNGAAGAVGADDRGGGILIDGSGYSGEITNCIIENNTSAFRGAGLYAEGGAGASLLITDTIVRNNTTGQGGGGGGGGLYVDVGFLGLTRVTLSGNSGGRGAGSYLASQEVEIWDSSIIQNQAQSFGGGV